MNLSSVKKFTAAVNTVILLLVFGLMGFFKAIDVSFLVYFSIPTALVYVVGFFLIHKGKLELYVRIVYFWLTFYMGVTTVCLGYAYGFHLYCFSVIPTIFVAEYMGYKLNNKPLKSVHFSLAIAVFYIICTGYVALFGPVYERDQKIAAFFWMFNALTVFCFLIGYSNYLIKSIITSEEKLVEAAHVDRLTKLYNRHYMLEHLERAYDNSKTVYLAMSDIDNFKKINDTYGHNGGDEVLKNVSEKMKTVCSECTVSRWGGEEFMILSHGTAEEVKALLENLRSAIEKEPVEFEGHKINVTVTIGFAAKKDGQSIDEWIQEADNKLYYGKNNGKNRVIE